MPPNARWDPRRLELGYRHIYVERSNKIVVQALRFSRLHVHREGNMTTVGNQV